MDHRKEFYKKLPDKKIQINWNKDPIKMDLFLSFIIVPLVISRDHLGSDNGWTMRLNDEHKLVVRGGVVQGVEYLDSLEYGHRLDNPYNNYVNPFYLSNIMTKEGIIFFAKYYKDEIEKVITAQKNTIDSTYNNLTQLESAYMVYKAEYNNLLN